ncbi:gastric triacylglycerol lipase-like [Diachasmimorpha longicaudata]|uniref:gastric triacylglycerol lipase-like n=1 Tax=Diachasmimorpha longicaudata TaxID=58733 RepID=UPI0030B8D345
MMKLPIYFLISLLLPSVIFSGLIPRTPKFRSIEDGRGKPFFALDILGLAKLHGRKIEWYNVTTEDGYILALHRILPNSSSEEENTTQRPVVLLQPGLIATSDVFVFFNSPRSLGYQLSDAGYDVWLGNFRGSTYCLNHERLMFDEPEFWDFSMDECALIDIPAQIDFALKMTNQSSLSFIGHSMGATAHIMLLSDRPEYNKKMDFVAYFAPVVYSITRNSRRDIVPFLTLIPQIFRPNGDYEVFSQNLLNPIVIYFCASTKSLLEWCQSLVDILAGYDRVQFQVANFLGLMTYYPAGSSAKVFYQYSQQTLTGTFRKFDYLTRDLNLQHYGQPTPPEYDMSIIDVPVMAIFTGPGDPSITNEDIKFFVKRMSPKQQQSVIHEVVKFPSFTHGSFILAKDIKPLVNDLVVDYLQKYYQNKTDGF